MDCCIMIICFTHSVNRNFLWKYENKKHCQTDSAYYFCNWLPFYRPCSFASQTFIWFADFLIIALILMQKNWFYYTIALYCTQEKHYRFNAPKNKKRTADTYTRTVLLLPKSTQHWHYCFLRYDSSQWRLGNSRQLR